MDEFASYNNKPFELVSYAGDFCILFRIDKHYNFNFIQVVCKYLEKVVNKLCLAFSNPKRQFTVFGDQKVVNLIPNQPISHTRQMKYVDMIIDYNLSFVPHIEFINKKCAIIYSKLKRLQRNTFGL